LTYCILDSDYHTAEEIRVRLEEAKEKDVHIHIWKKKELENYLIVFSAILRLINKTKKKGKELKLNVLIKKINEIAEDLKEITTDNFATHLQQQKKGISAGTAHKEAREMVKKSWLKDKLSIVSGKEVIKRLNQWSNNEYGTSLSINALASELLQDEIDNELKSVITAIEECKPFKS
jgi:hypothetical protein